jgi:ABC-type glycerol-3-phosphate transport system substrate-binding protein
MRKGLFKKSAAVCMAAVLMFSMTGCGGKSGTKEDEKKEDSKTMVYESSDIAVDGIKGDISRVIVKGDRLYFDTYEWIEEGSSDKEKSSDDSTGEEASEEDTGAAGEESTEEGAESENTTEEGTDEGKSEEEGEETPDTTEEDSTEDTGEDEEDAIEGKTISRLYVANLDGTDAKEIPLPEMSENEYMGSMMVNDSNEICIMLNSYDEKTEQSTTSILKLDETGKELSRGDITKALGLDENTYYNQIIMDGKGRIIAVMDNAVKILDENYKAVGEVKSDSYMDCAAVTKDGEIICGSSGENAAQVQVLDVDGKKWGDTMKLDLKYFSGSGSLMDGSGEYDFYYRDDNGIYGYSIEGQKSVKLMDFVASNLSSEDSWNIIPVSKDMFLGIVYDDDGAHLVKYNKVDPADIADKTVITVGASYVDDSVKKAAIEFNKTNKQYKIEFKDYSNEEDPDTKLNADIIAGNIPDVLFINDTGHLNQYISKGILEDLTPYFDKDSDISTEDIMKPVLEAMKVDDKLYYVAASFSVSTLVASSKDVGTESGWTFEDLKKLLEEKGDSVRPFYTENKSDMLWSLMGVGTSDFVDWKTGECSFDSQDFKDILEICNTGKNEETEYDEDAPSLPSLIQEGKVLFNEGYISLEEIQVYKKMYKDDITFVGYPNKNKEGSYFNLNLLFGISSKSDVKDGAWEFIRTFMTKEYQGTNGNIWDTPTRQDCYDMMVKAKMTTKTYTDELGQEISPMESTYGYDDLEVEIKPSSQEEVDMYTDLINSTKKVSGYDNEIMEIIQEEAKAYFAGEKSLDDTAAIIQNRVKTYVNENR